MSHSPAADLTDIYNIFKKSIITNIDKDANIIVSNNIPIRKVTRSVVVKRLKSIVCNGILCNVDKLVSDLVYPGKIYKITYYSDIYKYHIYGKRFCRKSQREHKGKLLKIQKIKSHCEKKPKLIDPNDNQPFYIRILCFF